MSNDLPDRIAKLIAEQRDSSMSIQVVIDIAKEIRKTDVPSVLPGYVIGKHDALAKLIKYAELVRDNWSVEELKAAYNSGVENSHRSDHDWFNEQFPNHAKQTITSG